MNDSRKLKEGAMWLVLYLLVLLSTIFIPMIELVTIFILPLPFLVFTARNGWKSGTVLFIISLVFASFFAFAVSFPSTLIAGLAGVFIGSAVYRKAAAYETWAQGTLGFVVGFVLIFLVIQMAFDVNIQQIINQSVDESLARNENLLEQLGMNISTEEMAGLREQIDLFLDLLPVMLVVSAMFFAFITQWLGYKLLNWLDKRGLKFPPFREYQLPTVLIWIYLFAMVCTWIASDTESALYIGAVNVVNLAGLLIALQGFSFLLFYTRKKRLSKAVPIIAILVVVLFPFIGLHLIRILGIIDLGFSLRDRVESNNK